MTRTRDKKFTKENEKRLLSQHAKNLNKWKRKMKKEKENQLNDKQLELRGLTKLVEERRKWA